MRRDRDSLPEGGLLPSSEDISGRVAKSLHSRAHIEGAVKIDVEHAGRARMICVVLKLNIDKYQYNETQFLTEAIYD